MYCVLLAVTHMDCKRITSFYSPDSPVIDFISGNITVLETDIDDVTLFCNTTGRPSPHLTWIRVRDSITMAHDNTLLIGAADRSDRGEYTCVADNGVGRPVSKSVYLDIQCKLNFCI